MIFYFLCLLGSLFLTGQAYAVLAERPVNSLAYFPKTCRGKCSYFRMNLRIFTNVCPTAKDEAQRTLCECGPDLFELYDECAECAKRLKPEHASGIDAVGFWLNDVAKECRAKGEKVPLAKAVIGTAAGQIPLD